MVVEVCANSFQSAVNAEKAGAHRIELCSELAVGGITPSYGLIKHVISKLKIPVFVLIRPRSGDFTYSDEEFEIMKKDILLCKDLGCKGIVSGVLDNHQMIDVARTKTLIELSKPLDFTFHRAFDWVPDPKQALKQLMDLKVKRVLTSGQELCAKKGISLLKDLREQAKGDLTVLPGGGVNSNNVMLFKEAGFSEIHVSATTVKTVISPPKVSMNNVKVFDETIKAYSDVAIIQELFKQL